MTDTKERLNEITVRANSGDAEAQFYLGERYYWGIGVEKDKKMALEWYQNSSKSGGIQVAASNACEMLLHGDGVERNYDEAFRLCSLAAQKEYASALTLLGEIYYQGYGKDKDMKSAFTYYEAAAKKGHVHAQYMLGYMYYKGLGVEKNIIQARSWFLSSTNGGHEFSRKMLERICPSCVRPILTEILIENELSTIYLTSVGTMSVKMVPPENYCRLDEDSPVSSDIRIIADTMIVNSSILGIFFNCNVNSDENDVYIIAIKDKDLYKQYFNQLNEWLPQIASGFKEGGAQVVSQDEYGAYATTPKNLSTNSVAIELQTGISMVLGKPLIFYRINNSTNVDGAFSKLSNWIKSIHILNTKH